MNSQLAVAGGTAPSHPGDTRHAPSPRPGASLGPALHLAPGSGGGRGSVCGGNTAVGFATLPARSLSQPDLVLTPWSRALARLGLEKGLGVFCGGWARSSFQES